MILFRKLVQQSDSDMSQIHSQRVEAIREMMRSKGWNAVVITGTDPHSSEYPAARWKQVEWVSAFTGEAGDLIITMDHAGLFTDSRYFIQAASQLQGSNIQLHKSQKPIFSNMTTWLAENLFPGAVVAFDSLCMSIGEVQQLSSVMSSAYGEDDYKLASTPDMLDSIWEDRPAIPQTPVTTLDQETVGQTRLEKVDALRKFMLGHQNCEYLLLSSLDEIAWVLNVRGQDIDYNPYVISHLLVTLDKIIWYVKKSDYVEPQSETDDSFEELEADGIEICRYEDLSFGFAHSEEYPARIFFDPSSTNYDVFRQIRYNFSQEDIISGTSPVIEWKACKSEVEISGMREAFVEDGLQEEKFLYWLETSVKNGEDISEWDASVKLTSLRAEIPGYRGDSFENISAYGANAALPHYITPEEGSARIQARGLYLVDSGGQYLFGTTDITRTVPMGELTELEKEDYTLVLKGMIDLSMAVFPFGTSGSQIDCMARMPLWRSFRNFGHGTGHGIGFYLGVHEGPQSLRQNHDSQPLLPGMITSNEPGLYREGTHGIRHENVILCVEKEENEFGRWLGFETLTRCHIETSAIKKELLEADEIKWLNDYNESVYRCFADRLPYEIANWLRIKTLAI